MKAKPLDSVGISARGLTPWLSAWAPIQQEFPIVFKNVRRALLRRFPYARFFAIEGDTLFVIACFHASRDPLQWQKRT